MRQNWEIVDQYLSTVFTWASILPIPSFGNFIYLLAYLLTYKRRSLVSSAVDASEAGAGNIEIVINDGRVPCHVTLCTASLFRASFVPKETTVHYVAMTFNGCKVPGIAESAACTDRAPSRIRRISVSRKSAEKFTAIRNVSRICSAEYQPYKIWQERVDDNWKLAYEWLKWYSGVQTVKHYVL